jgi:4-hydroxybenzoate polyprenyltransferase
MSHELSVGENAEADAAAPPALPALPARRQRVGRTVVGFVRACHLEPTIAVTTVVTLLAASAGRGPAGTVAVAVAVLAGQLSVGWSNDYLDADRDRAAQRVRKPIVSGGVDRDAVGIAAVFALVVAAGLSFLSGWPAALAHIAGVGAAWAYNARLKNTVFSAVPYAVAFGLLPGFVVWGLPGQPAPPAWLVATGALLGVGAHFANVLPDLELDAVTGVRGLPHRLGRRMAGVVAVLTLVAASAVLLFASGAFSVTVGVVVLAAAIAVTAGAMARVAYHPTSPLLFRVSMLIALVDVVLLLVSGNALR